MYVSGRVNIFDMVDINLFTVVALNMMVLKLGYTGEFEPMFYNYLRPLISLDEGLYALSCEEDVRWLATLVRSFKLIMVYIEHGVTVLDSYLRAPRETTKELVCYSVTPSSLPQHDPSTPCKDSVCESITPRPKSKNAKVRVNTEESAVKPEPELKNTIECNLNPSDGPGKPNSISMKTVKTKWALNQLQQPICVQSTKTVKTLKARS
ncbi:hypothetical protein Tco_0445257 [Tanacetum coccineum]